MRHRRGFTIVELVVVMVIMAILITLSTLGFSRSQANARDSQRNTSIDIIARGLENRYKQGNATITAPATVAPGAYPDINEMKHILGTTVASFTPSSVSGGYPADALPGTSVVNFTPPGTTGFTGFVIPTCAGTCAVNDSAVIGSTAGNTVTPAKYYYEPINAKGNICNVPGQCVRYNLYWETEVDNVNHIIRSKYQ